MEDAKMGKIVRPLTAIQVKNAKPKEKSYKMFDGGGLYLEVTPAHRRHRLNRFPGCGLPARYVDPCFWLRPA